MPCDKLILGADPSAGHEQYGADARQRVGMCKANETNETLLLAGMVYTKETHA